MPTIMERLQHAYNVFRNGDSESNYVYRDYGPISTYRPDVKRFSRGNERTIITSVYNRIATDCASIDIKHVRLDENDRYVYDIDSGLNQCLTVEANIDQTGRAFVQDVVMTMLDEGTVAIVPVETSLNPKVTGSWDVDELRVGRISKWYPEYISAYVYNVKTGKREEVQLPKKSTGIVENPFYAIMNEPNSTMQRLIRKLNLLDAVDEQSSSGKLDLIIQLPYVIRSEKRKEQAQARRKELEDQLNNSKYGVAYTDGTERVIQLNRGVENNLMKQVEYLTEELYAQLGITKEILNGTAKDEEMLNYYNRTIEPIMTAITEEMYRKFLTKTARSQKQSIKYFRDPFKLVPVSQLADIADKFTRNEIMSSNEMRQIVGYMPVQDERADELRNKNINSAVDQSFASTIDDEGMSDESAGYEGELANLDAFDKQLDELESMVGG